MAILSLYALYVVAINVFLSTSLFEKVFNGRPDRFFISFERGWSIFPGRVHARKLTLRHRDSQVEFQLRIEKVVFRVSFLDLALKKKFHASDVDGTGVTFEARRRLEAPALTNDYVAAIPQIPGFPEIPVRPDEPPDLLERWDDRHWHLWTVELEDVVANDVRMLWIDAVRFEGSARVEGSFYLKPLRDVRIGPIHADVYSGGLVVKQRPVVDPIAGALDLRVTAFDPRVVERAELLHSISVSTDLHGGSPDLANLPKALTAPLKLAGPADVRRLAIKIEDGHVVSGSHVDVVVPGASVEVAQHRFAGDVALVADVARDVGPPRLTFRLDARVVTGNRVEPQHEALLFHAQALDVSGDATALDIAHPLRDLHVVAVLPAGELPDARVLDRYVPRDTAFRFEGGRAWAHARLEAWVADRRAKGAVGLQADDFDFRIAKARVKGSTSLDASFEALRWDDMRLEGAKARIGVAQGSIASQRAPDKVLVSVRGFDIALDSAVVDLNDPLRDLSAKVVMPDAEIVDRGLLRRYLPKGEEMQVTKGQAKFDARCEVDVKDHKARGTVDIHADRIGLTIHELQFLADVRAHARVHDWAWEHGDLALDQAKVEIGRVSAHASGSKVAALTIKRIVVEARSDRFEISDPLERVALKARIDDGTVTDPIAINAFLPKDSDIHFDVAPDDARFGGRLSAKVEKHVANGNVSAHAHGVGVRGKKVGVRGDIDVTAEVEKWNLDESRLSVKSSLVAVNDVEVRFGETNVANGGKDGRDGGPDLRAKHLALRVKIEDFAVAHPSLRGGDYRIVLEGGKMDDARRLNELLPRGEAFAFEVESGRALASADISVIASQRTAGGGLRVALDGAGVRFHETHIGGDFEIAVDVKGFEPDRDGIDISGSRITMRNVHAVGAAVETNAWNGDLRLLQAAVHVSERPGFEAFVQLHADNANPFLAMVLRDSLPKFVVGLMKAPELSGQARIMVAKGRTAIRDAHLRGGDVVLIGDYVVVGDRTRAVATVAKGPLSAGIKVDGQGTFVRLWNLEEWREEEKRRVTELFAEGEKAAKAQADAKAKASADAKADAKAKEAR